MSNVAIMFPGVGSQYNNMGKEIIENPIAKNVFLEAEEAIGYPLIELIKDGQISQIKDSQILQPLLITYGIASFRLLQEYVEPNIFLGHSLGEITALVAAGYLDFSQAVMYAVRRGRYYDKAKDKGEVAIVLDIENEELLELVKQAGANTELYVTGYNTQRQFLVAGTKKGIVLLGRLLSKTKAMFVPYRVLPMKENIPVHCNLMKAKDEDVVKYEGEIMLTDKTVISSVNAKPYTSTEEVRNHLVIQLFHPVLWYQAMQTMEEFEPEFIIEAGPQRTLKDFYLEMNVLGKERVFAMDINDDFENLKSYLR
ncbi:ACP S-malonyltransferase [[Clostridium] polysaccharolyticum]|uniref:Malonyl CoA-acyl carrier protein transacylase n=1 Tax=[Clostridium] polysaccharolyticum TaxID=29364 RepID=A0A1I0E4X9_9FIRM|nr:ACP S-malonyltransferase [[Clostridium] polysaccharolyticum]SET39941.1 [acyl-carrier-protein] S-malonyltransferase [[Clostridium] polysaccharolyticum]